MRRSSRLLVLLLIASLGALAGCTGGTDAVDQTADGQFRFVAGTTKGHVIPEGDRKLAPPVDGTLLDGAAWQLAPLRGKVVVLNFWASWCGPCRVESPDFDRAYKATKADGVDFVGVAVKDLKQSAAAFVAGHKISYPSVFDQPGKTVLRFRGVPLSGFPFTIVIDKQGRVAAAYMVPLLREDIEPVVKQLAAEG